ncbi:hypothetical protein F5X99DRAFT_238852 [Biscogniauxia marginata]|nr:hypothetical protein F5X99DRAFT_238852 [Biscogniauxia marginata]
MSIDISDLTDDDVVSLTRLLCRRPEYGIAIPSGKWLRRQEEKTKYLSKHMLRPTNPLRRFVMRIADSIDPNMVDPQAVLCQTHAVLNPWLIRRLFLAVAYEVTVHSDALRSWNGRTAIPALSAFVARLDAVNALWTEPDLYHECYGTAPFQNHMIYVKSGCEACILGAVGANAQVLADLRAILIDRTERRPERPDGRRSKGPRLVRVVEGWIDHLGEDRAARCREWSDDVLVELRATRSEVRRWRGEQKREHKRSRAARQSVYMELRRSDSGHRLSSVPSDARRRRRTRHGIPMALADREGADEQRRAAMYSHTTGAESVFRPDSLCNFSQAGKRQRSGHDTQTSRPIGPEPVRMSGPSNGSPTRSFIQRFEREVAVDEEQEPYDDYEEEQEFEERDFEQEERSRTKVRDWYATRLADQDVDDTKSSLSMIHPAFQPQTTYGAPSAVPQGLHVKKDRDPSKPQVKTGTRHADSRPTNQSAMWTDATVYTVDPSNAAAPDPKDVPPIPRVPSRYNKRQEHQQPGAREIPISSPIDRSTSSRPPDPGPDEKLINKDTPLNWPAPASPPQPQPQPQPRAGMQKPTRKYLFQDSEAGSRLTATQKQYLRDHREMKDFAKEDNPFTRAGRGGGGRTTHDDDSQSPTAVTGSSTTTTSARGRYSRDRDRDRAASSTAPPPSLSYSHGDTIDGDGESEFEPVRPDDSVSNAFWRRSVGAGAGAPDSDVTSFGAFMRQAGARK